MAGSFLEALAAAHDWCESLGSASRQARHCRLVSDPGHPEIWAANHAASVRASTAGDIAETLDDIEAAFAQSPYRVVDTDAFTPPEFLAHLALEDWQEQPAAILMALRGQPSPVGPAGLDIRVVESDADAAELSRLHVLDAAESSHSAEIAEGLHQMMRTKAAAGRIFLVRVGGQARAYALAVPAPGGFGFIDDVFTDPAFRRRGLASALVVHCARHLSGEGCETAFLTARVSDSPKRIYARLGFEPEMLVRRWVKTIA